MHDWHRKEYESILQLYDIVAEDKNSSRDLGVFKPKPHINKKDLIRFKQNTIMNLTMVESQNN